MRSLLIAAVACTALIMAGCSATLCNSCNPTNAPLLTSQASHSEPTCDCGECNSCESSVVTADLECGCSTCQKDGVAHAGATANSTGLLGRRDKTEQACRLANRPGLLNRVSNMSCTEKGCRLRGHCSCSAGIPTTHSAVAEEAIEAGDCGCEDAAIVEGPVEAVVAGPQEPVGLLNRERQIRQGPIRSHLAQKGHIGHGHIGCGQPGCGIGGQICAHCRIKLDKIQAIRRGPGLGTIPHTQQPPYGGPGFGGVPSYVYPYYTTRGPRDFLMKNPPSIGY